MAYKFQRGAATLDGALSGSVAGFTDLSASNIVGNSPLMISSSATTISGNVFICNGTASIAHLSGCSPIQVHAPMSSSQAISASSFWVNGVQLTGGAGGTPGGYNTTVQFNDGGSFGGDSGLVFNKTTDTLTIGGDLSVCAGTASIAHLSGCSPIQVHAPMQIQSGNSLTFDGASNNFKITNNGQNLDINGANIILNGAVSASANVSASAFYGDGSNLTGITASAVNVDTTTDKSNATFYVPFVNQSTGQGGETLYIHDVLSINPSSSLVKISETGNNAASLVISSSTGDSAFEGSGSLLGSVGFPGVSGSTDTSTYIAGGYVDFGDGDWDILTIHAPNNNGVIQISASNTIFIESDTIEFEGPAIANNGLTSIGEISGSGKLNIGGNATIGGNLAIGGDVTLGDANSDSIQVTGRLDVGSAMRFDSIEVITGASDTLDTTNSYVIGYRTGSAQTLSLPTSPTKGDWFAIKRHSGMGQLLTIQSASAGGGKQIDGENSIDLESDGASVFLIYDGDTANWNIF